MLVHNDCPNGQKPRTRNGKLAGNKHPITNVPFDETGFPIFES